MKSLIFAATILLVIQSHANDSCETIVKRSVQASFVSQTEYEITSEPKLILETNPRTGMEIYNTWLVKSNEGTETGGFETTVVTARRPERSNVEGCKIIGIY